NKLYHEDYVKLHTNASFIVAPGYEFNDGLFSGYDETKKTYNPATWDYDRLPPAAPPAPATPPAPGTPPPAPLAYAQPAPTLEDPRSGFTWMKAHYARYTPEKVSEIAGMPVEKFTDSAKRFGATGVPEKVGSIVYAVGLTHHVTGVQIIRGIGLVQLLL